MKLPLMLAVGACAAVLASPALAIEQIHIPDPSAAHNSGPPDALFDKSVPTTWQEKAKEKDSNPLGTFHFSATGGSSYGNSYGSTSRFGEDAKVPDSEFFTNGVPLYQDPFAPQ